MNSTEVWISCQRHWPVLLLPARSYELMQGDEMLCTNCYLDRLWHTYIEEQPILRGAK